MSTTTVSIKHGAAEKKMKRVYSFFLLKMTNFKVFNLFQSNSVLLKFCLFGSSKLKWKTNKTCLTVEAIKENAFSGEHFNWSLP